MFAAAAAAASDDLPQFKADWIEQALEAKALIFGDFTLKSGRQSPYFFNAGLLFSGPLLSSTAQSYASSLIASPIGSAFDVLFGPAYKGIPLAAVTCLALSERHACHRDYCYNRKEKKDHGEGGNMVGASMDGRKVVMIDDVLTSGKAIREAIALLPPSAELVGCIILVDRQERGASSSKSTVQELSDEYAVPVVPIVGLNDIILWMERKGGPYAAQLEKMKAYRAQWGAVAL